MEEKIKTRLAELLAEHAKLMEEYNILLKAIFGHNVAIGELQKLLEKDIEPPTPGT